MGKRRTTALRVVERAKQIHPAFAESWAFQDELLECLVELDKSCGTRGRANLIRLARMRGDAVAQFRSLSVGRLVANPDELKPVVSQPPLKELKFPAQSLERLRVYFAEEGAGEPDYVLLLAHLKGDGGVQRALAIVDQNRKMASAQQRYVDERDRRWGHLPGPNACPACEALDKL